MIRLDKVRKKSHAGQRKKWQDEEIGGTSDTISSEDASDYEISEPGRERPTQEIWNDEQIWNDLQNLDEAERCIQLLNYEDNDVLLEDVNNETVLLLALWLEKNDVVEKVLNKYKNIEAKDTCGRYAVHLAAYIGNAEGLKLLIHHGAKVDTWDTKYKVTPLHCAASKGNLECIKILIRHGADVNSGIKTSKSPLHFAVYSMATEAVAELLDNGATPNTTQVFSETPLHVAAALGSSEIINLLLKHGAAVDIQCGFDKVTPLHLAASEGDPECCRLLLRAKAPTNARNHKLQTPLHLAALSQCAETLEVLLRAGADPNATDIDGRTPLHSSIVKVTRSCECVRLLLKHGTEINKPDAFGYTALHLAALNEFSHCVMFLINNGGDVTARTNGGISVLNFITRKTPDVIPKYLLKFDESIRLNDHEIGDVDCELKLDFRALVPSMGHKETELLLNFIEVGHKDILKHPLCETFLFLKWRRIRKFFLFSLFYHSLFVSLFSFYILGVFLKDCTPSNSLGSTFCDVNEITKIIGYTLISLNVLMLGKELFQIAHSWRTYIKQWENWLQWMIIICVFACVNPHSSRMNIRTNIQMWQHHVAAVGIFLTWLELMMIVGRFPTFGLYIQMFTTVSVNFVKFMAAYFCLLLAFALCFGVIFANYNSFKRLPLVLIKVIVMMSGELEYEDIFFDETQPIKFPWTAQVMFLAFVVLVTIILTNLMVGLAVSDIQGLQQSAGLDRLVRQAELVAHLESMLFSKLLICIPNKLMKFLHRQSLLLKSEYHWALYIRPNDPRETRIPKYIITNIYNLVVEKREKLRKRFKKRITEQYSGNTNSFVSPGLSRINSYMSYVAAENPKGKSVRSQVDDLGNEFIEFTRSFKTRLEKMYRQLSSDKNEKGAKVNKQSSLEKDYQII
ncbi:transient receptor potential channel pyrexia-like [Coccinella septempunctata]|uniref:transient receptor potential channel pyrexia-like n=1 Tax=Coccinella septempunctata TaxID=41139 RepID=UPI001D074757|nr:transient receptor potential channel pyrexia-like [Coccinella septempunctata]